MPVPTFLLFARIQVQSKESEEISVHRSTASSQGQTRGRDLNENEDSESEKDTQGPNIYGTLETGQRSQKDVVAQGAHCPTLNRRGLACCENYSLRA